MVDLDSVADKFSIASLLIHFFEDLDDPLLTTRLYDVFLSIKGAKGS
jgi:hypothetical protein